MGECSRLVRTIFDRTIHHEVYHRTPRSRRDCETSTVEKADALHAPDLKAELVQLAKSGHLNIVWTSQNLVIVIPAG